MLMTSTMITLAEAAGTSVASFTTAPPAPGGGAGGVIGTLNSLFASGTDLAKNGITLGILAIGGWTIVKAKMAMAAVITVVIVAGLAMWWVRGGLFSTSDKAKVDLGAPTQLHDPAARLRAAAGPVPAGERLSARVSPTALPTALPFAA